MRYQLLTQTPDRQHLDALLLALDAPAARLAGVVTSQFSRGDCGGIVEQLRYLANLIEAHGATPV